jgi:hypothetical protein
VQRLVLVLAAIVLPASALADEGPPQLAGRWQAGPLSEVWSVEAWGEACGPRPTGGSTAGGLVTIEQRGAELSISGLGRNFSTQQCWEQFPGLAPASHSAAQRSWKTVCRTSPQDPRQATVTTSLAAQDSLIEFAESGSYQFAIQGQSCKATVRRSRSYRLLERASSSTPPVPQAVPTPTSAATPAPAKAREPACATPGPPTRLEVRPSRRMMRAGESFTFSAQVLDESGCQVQLPVRWELADGRGLTLSPTGAVAAASDAPEQKATLRALAERRSVDVFIEVVSKARYEALLSQGDFNPSDAQAATVTIVATGALGAEGSSVQTEGSERSRLLVLALLAIALLGVGAVVLLRGRGRSAPRVEPSEAPAALGPKGKICPICGEQYPPDATFCGKDGASLLPIN